MDTFTVPPIFVWNAEADEALGALIDFEIRQDALDGYPYEHYYTPANIRRRSEPVPAEIPRHLLNNFDFMLACVSHHGMLLKFASLNEQVTQKHNVQQLPQAPWIPDEDRNILQSIYEHFGDELPGEPSGLRGDRRIVMAAVSQNWRALQFASNELRSDSEVVSIATAQESAALTLATKDYILDTLSRDGHQIKHIGYYKSDLIMNVVAMRNKLDSFLYGNLLRKKRHSIFNNDSTYLNMEVLAVLLCLHTLDGKMAHISRAATNVGKSFDNTYLDIHLREKIAKLANLHITRTVKNGEVYKFTVGADNSNKNLKSYKFCVDNSRYLFQIPEINLSNLRIRRSIPFTRDILPHIPMLIEDYMSTPLGIIITLGMAWLAEWLYNLRLTQLYLFGFSVFALVMIGMNRLTR